MTLLQILIPVIVVAVLVGIVHWTEFIPPTWKRVISGIAIIVVLVWLFQGLGGCSYLDKVRVGK